MHVGYGDSLFGIEFYFEPAQSLWWIRHLKTQRTRLLPFQDPSAEMLPCAGRLASISLALNGGGLGCLGALWPGAPGIVLGAKGQQPWVMR